MKIPICLFGNAFCSIWTSPYYLVFVLVDVIVICVSRVFLSYSVDYTIRSHFLNYGSSFDPTTNDIKSNPLTAITFKFKGFHLNPISSHSNLHLSYNRMISNNICILLKYYCYTKLYFYYLGVSLFRSVRIGFYKSMLNTFATM